MSNNTVQQNIFREISVLDTLVVLTNLNLFFSNHKHHIKYDEYQDIQNTVLSYIISSGNILNSITKIPIELDVYIDELNKYTKEILKVNKVL